MNLWINLMNLWLNLMNLWMNLMNLWMDLVNLWMNLMNLWLNLMNLWMNLMNLWMNLMNLWMNLMNLWMEICYTHLYFWFWLKGIRQQMGVCPQHDILFPEVLRSVAECWHSIVHIHIWFLLYDHSYLISFKQLTVMEHLELYGAVKGCFLPILVVLEV